MDNNLNVAPVPPPPQKTHRWSAYQHPILLVSFGVGIVVFLVWLPNTSRATLFAALSAQQALISMFFLFVLVALSLLWSAGNRLDTWIFQSINLRGYHRKWLDHVGWLVTQLGGTVAVCVLTVLLFVLHFRPLAIEVILGTLTLGLIVEIFKALTDRARPFLALTETRVIGWRERGRSFPSGHTAQIFFLASLLSQRFHLGMGEIVALYAVAMLVGFTRIYVGVHFPRDVIGGALLGSVWGVLATLIAPQWLSLVVPRLAR